MSRRPSQKRMSAALGLAIELRGKGATLQAICNALAEAGYKTARGGKVWQPSVIRRMLDRSSAPVSGSVPVAGEFGAEPLANEPSPGDVKAILDAVAQACTPEAMINAVFAVEFLGANNGEAVDIVEQSMTLAEYRARREAVKAAAPESGSIEDSRAAIIQAIRTSPTLREAAEKLGVTAEELNEAIAKDRRIREAVR